MLGKIKLGISMGDPNGIGIEIILKIFEDKRLFDFFTTFEFCFDPKWLAGHRLYRSGAGPIHHDNFWSFISEQPL